MNGIQINETDVFNFLGIVFDNKLRWKNHVSFVSGKIAKNIYVLKTSQFIYPENILKLLYCSLIQSKLLYGLLLWGVELNDILLLQKKAIRCVTSSKFHSHTEPLIKKLQILNIKDLYNLHVLKFCFKLYNLELPVFLFNYLDTINDKCQFYNLRHNHIRIPIHNHSFAKYKLLFECIRILQNTPLIIIDKIFTHSFETFTLYVKNYFISSYNRKCNVSNCYTCLKSA